jgi:hypothetical protein
MIQVSGESVLMELAPTREKWTQGRGNIPLKGGISRDPGDIPLRSMEPWGKSSDLTSHSPMARHLRP